MSANKATVERYMEGFQRSDHAQILSCLTDDVVYGEMLNAAFCDVFLMTKDAKIRHLISYLNEIRGELQGMK